MPTFSDVVNAHIRIQNLINNTSVLTSRTFNKLVNANVFFKCENFQRAGSFKFRGVTNKLLLMKKNDKMKGIITHSSGNHAQAVALACSNLGIKSLVVMPKNSPKVKIDAVKEYGSEIIFCDNKEAQKIVKAVKEVKSYFKDEGLKLYETETSCCV